MKIPERWQVVVHPTVTQEECAVLTKMIGEQSTYSGLAVDFVHTRVGGYVGVVALYLCTADELNTYPELKKYLQGYLRAMREFKGKAVALDPAGAAPQSDYAAFELSEYARALKLFALAEAYAAEVKDGVPEDPGPAEDALLSYARRDSEAASAAGVGAMSAQEVCPPIRACRHCGVVPVLDVQKPSPRQPKARTVFELRCLVCLPSRRSKVVIGTSAALAVSLWNEESFKP